MKIYETIERCLMLIPCMASIMTTTVSFPPINFSFIRNWISVLCSPFLSSIHSVYHTKHNLFKLFAKIEIKFNLHALFAVELESRTCKRNSFEFLVIFLLQIVHNSIQNWWTFNKVIVSVNRFIQWGMLSDSGMAVVLAILWCVPLICQ